jgi:hypothetical protein
MKSLMGLLAAMLLLAGVGTGHAVVRIANDRGGQIGRFPSEPERGLGDLPVVCGSWWRFCRSRLAANITIRRLRR